MKSSSRSVRFDALDGLRGIAALAVVAFHRRWLAPDGHFLDHAYLAVDFFFALSGFVLAHAYSRRLGVSIGFVSFVKLRVLRLYPLYLLGVALGATVWLQTTHASDVIFPVISILLFLPSIVALPAKPDSAFAINEPAWSLSFEMLANFMFYFVGRRPIAMIAICVISLLWLIVAGKPLGGYSYSNLIDGLPRVALSFFGGCLLYAALERFEHVLSRVRFGGWLGFLALGLALLAVFSPDKALQDGLLYDLAMITMVFPVIIILGALCKVTGKVATTTSLLGELSYPVYILHFPLLFALEKVGLPQDYMFIVGSLPIVALIAFVFWKVYDLPLRKYLRSPQKLRHAWR